MGNTSCYQAFGQIIRGLDGNCTNQDGLSFFITIFNIGYNRIEFEVQIWIEQVFMVFTDNRFIGRNWNHAHIVNFTEFFFFGLSRTCHPCQFLIHTEHILVGDGGTGFGFILNRNPFFGLNSLVQAIRVATAFHSPTCKWIDDHNLLGFIDQVVNLIDHNVVGTKGIVNEVGKGYIFDIVEIFQAEERFCLINP